MNGKSATSLLKL